MALLPAKTMASMVCALAVPHSVAAASVARMDVLMLMCSSSRSMGRCKCNGEWYTKNIPSSAGKRRACDAGALPMPPGRRAGIIRAWARRREARCGPPARRPRASGFLRKLPRAVRMLFGGCRLRRCTRGQAVLHRDQGRLGATARMELLKDASHIVLDGLFGEVETLGDLAVAGTQAKEFDNVVLACRSLGERIACLRAGEFDQQSRGKRGR